MKPPGFGKPEEQWWSFAADEQGAGRVEVGLAGWVHGGDQDGVFQLVRDGD